MMKTLPEARPRADGQPAARYVTLDGMRGLAAIAVALFHFDIFLMPHGYVAVDFFFVLSGFVLYRSYLPKFREGLGVGRFMLQRFARLYPLFLLGLMLGLAVALQQIWTTAPHAPSSGDLATTMLFNGLMLPSPAGLPYYPLNVPSWSLFFEIVANLALIVLIFRLPRVALAAICVIAAVGMVPIILDNGSGNIGALWGEHGIALMRTAFSFTLGVIIAMLPEGTCGHPVGPAWPVSLRSGCCSPCRCRASGSRLMTWRSSSSSRRCWSISEAGSSRYASPRRPPPLSARCPTRSMPCTGPSSSPCGPRCATSVCRRSRRRRCFWP